MGRKAKNSIRITDERIKKYLGKEKEYIVWDSDLPGFGIRVRPNGGKFFTLKYSIGKGRGAPSRKASLGKHSQSNPVSKARSIAEDWKAQARTGRDPYRELQAVAEDEQKERSPKTMGDLAQDYVVRHAMENKSEKAGNEDLKNLFRIGLVDLDFVRRFIGNYKPQPGKSKKQYMKHLKNTKVTEVTVRDIEDLHHSNKKSPYQANRLIALLRMMFNLSIRWGWQTTNPASSIQRYHEEERERYLSEDEMARLFDALDKLTEKTSVDAIRMMFLTGSRKTEVLRMRWDEVDMDEGTWTKRSAHTKQKKTHRVKLSAPAVQLLDQVRQRHLDDKWVFPGRVPGLPLSDVKKTFSTAVKDAGITHQLGTRPYDSRHSFASVLASSGLSLYMIGKLMGHTQQKTTARYAHLSDDPLRAATAKMGEAYERATKKDNEEAPEAEIIDFPA